MNRTDAHALLERLLHGIAPDVDLAEADEGVPLQAALDLDSMDFLNLVTALHRETGIDVPARDYPRLATIAGFVEYVAAATGVEATARTPVTSTASTDRTPSAASR